MTRRLLASLLLVLACYAGEVGPGPGLPVASACPMCKAANDQNDARPRAYMVSILFMLAVPACLFSGLGIGLYRLNRSEAERLEAAGHAVSDE